MKNILMVAALAAAAVNLSGCSATDLAKAFGVPTPPPQQPPQQQPPQQQPPTPVVGDISGDGTVSTGEQVLAAYTPTFATANGPDVTTLQQGGLQGFGASSANSLAAAQSIGTFKVATISLAAGGTSLTVSVDGQNFVLPQALPPVTGPLYGGGPNTTFYAFGAAPGHSGSQGFQYTQTHSALTAFVKDLVVSTQNSPASHGGYALVATGAETPAANMPAQIATYRGFWGLEVVDGGMAASGNFNATANFANKTLTYDVMVNGPNSTTLAGGGGSATISGNKFSGAFNNTMTSAGYGANNPSAPTGACVANCTWNGTGEVIGAFYGPNAEELAGVLSGSSTSTEGKTSPMVGGFIGSKQ